MRVPVPLIGVSITPGSTVMVVEFFNTTFPFLYTTMALCGLASDVPFPKINYGSLDIHAVLSDVGILSLYLPIDKLP